MLKQKTPLKRTGTLKTKTSLKAYSKLKTKTSLQSNSSLKSNSQLKCNTKLKSTVKLKTNNYKKTVKDVTMNLAIPKFARVINQETIEACKRPNCEICGRMTNNEPHHIISRGAGGPDIAENLIQLCPICHTKAHSGSFSKQQLFNIIARRLNTTSELIEEKIKKIRGRI